MKKRIHEVRDPIHTFIRLDTDEREVLDSKPVQRLRHIHQLAMSHMVYPAATHKRFEHSLGVMELAGRVFDVVTEASNLQHDSVRRMVSEAGDLPYWRRVLRMAALCHDVGHLPFSHAAESELLPADWDHERLTVELIRSMQSLWQKMTPPLRWLDIVKLAVGPKKCASCARAGSLSVEEAAFNDWETILAEVIVGDAFGVDRMDYLLRDSYHAGVAYGRFDHFRLVDTLRILPREYDEQSQEPGLGVEEGGRHSAEALLLARYFMYMQVYFHPVRRIYDVHLKDFLSEWLAEHETSGTFPTTIDGHLAITDNEVMAAILAAAPDGGSPGHESARRIVERDHYHLIYERNPDDAALNSRAADVVFKAACERFGAANVRRDARPAKNEEADFPVLTRDRRVTSSFMLSKTLAQIPVAAFDFVFIEPGSREEAEKWLMNERDAIIQLKDVEEADGPAEA